jgi:D-amino-acid dehydrogenase
MSGLASGGSVLVVGGGVIGLSCAFTLRQRGYEVTVADSGELGAAASFGNGGWICPSLSGPVPGPGVLANSLRWMLRPDSPLLIRPGLSPSLWSWLLAFARRCNQADFLAGLRAVAGLAASSSRLFAALQAAGVDFEFHQQGLLFLFRSLKAAREEMGALLLMEEFGCPPATWMEAEQLAGFEPLAAAVPMVGILAPDDKHVRPETLTAGLIAWLAAAGVRLLPEMAVDHLRLANRHVISAVTRGGDELEADAFVLAAGVGTRYLGGAIGVSIPLIGGKGYSLTYESCAPLLRHPVYLSEAKVAISPYDEGVRVLGTMELGSRTEAVSQSRLDAMVRACERYLPGLNFVGEPRPWAGMRPMVPDGLPVIGGTSAAANVVVATGHAMLGITLAPATGEMVADILEERQLEAFASAFSPSRF